MTRGIASVGRERGCVLQGMRDEDSRPTRPWMIAASNESGPSLRHTLILSVVGQILLMLPLRSEARANASLAFCSLHSHES